MTFYSYYFLSVLIIFISLSDPRAEKHLLTHNVDNSCVGALSLTSPLFLGLLLITPLRSICCSLQLRKLRCAVLCRIRNNKIDKKQLTNRVSGSYLLKRLFLPENVI